MRQRSCADPGRGDRDPPPPLKNHKAIGVLSNTDPDPLKYHKATKPAFKVGQSSASWQWTVFGSIWILPPLVTKKKQKTIQNVRVGSPLTKLMSGGDIRNSVFSGIPACFWKRKGQ